MMIWLFLLIVLVVALVLYALAMLVEALVGMAGGSWPSMIAAILIFGIATLFTLRWNMEFSNPEVYYGAAAETAVATGILGFFVGTALSFVLFLWRHVYRSWASRAEKRRAGVH